MTTSSPTTAPGHGADFERHGVVEQFNFHNRSGHAVHFDTYTDFGYLLEQKGSPVSNAKGGCLLVRFDVDSEDYSVVHVDPAGGWWPQSGKGPTELVARAVEYLTAVQLRLEAFESVINAEAAR